MKKLRIQAIEALNCIFREDLHGTTDKLIKSISDKVPLLLKGIVENLWHLEQDSFFVTLESVLQYDRFT